MNNKTRIIIGVVIAVLFVIGIVALVQTQPINSSEPTKITNQNDTQIQNNSTDTIEMESNTVVKYSLNKDKSSKVNANSKNKSVNVTQNRDILNKSFTKSITLISAQIGGKQDLEIHISDKVFTQGSESVSDSLKLPEI